MNRLSEEFLSSNVVSVLRIPINTHCIDRLPGRSCSQTRIYYKNFYFILHLQGSCIGKEKYLLSRGNERFPRGRVGVSRINRIFSASQTLLSNFNLSGEQSFGESGTRTLLNSKHSVCIVYTAFNIDPFLYRIKRK